MDFDYSDLLDSIQHGVYFVDKDRRVIYWNKSATEITGFESEAVIGLSCSDNLLVHVDRDGRNLCLDRCPLAAVMTDGTPREMIVYLRHREGHRLPIRVNAVPLRNPSGEIIGAAELFSDVSSTSAMEIRVKELEELSLIDPLSKLANRRRLNDELKSRFEEKERYGLAFGILFMDIDNFKQINDKHGHRIGDLVIQTIASTLTSISRPFDLIGRWGGDEILAIVRSVNLNLLVEIGERYGALVSQSCVHMKEEILCPTLSIGAVLAEDEDTPESMIHAADELMYKSKKKGGNSLTYIR